MTELGHHTLVVWNCGVSTHFMVRCSDSSIKSDNSVVAATVSSCCHQLRGGGGSLCCRSTLKSAALGTYVI